MDTLRDPIWQFVGVAIAALAGLVAVVRWLLTKRRASDANPVVIGPVGRSPAGTKHKKRKSDGILVANISSDFLNQFPLSVSVMAEHLDGPYTPENFGASDWLTVFRRFTSEGYFRPVKGSPKRLRLDSLVNAGPKLEDALRSAAAMKRSIAGLDDEP